MRKAVIFGTFAVAFIAGAGKPAKAEVLYPWCAFHDASTSNCGFSNFYQCQANISGIGGYCARNPRFYYHASEAYGADYDDLPRRHRRIRR